MSATLRQVADAIQSSLGEAPATAIVLGSGLGGLVAKARNRRSVPYAEVGLPETSVEGHVGRLVTGRLGGVPVAFLSGRVHVYEGRPMEEVVLAVRALATWGVQRVVLTSAAGAVDPSLQPGDILLVEDHINLMGHNPLVGSGDALGPRFPDLSRAYDPELRASALALAEALGMKLHRGVLGAMLGPSYETPAEVRMLGMLGAHTVGMSTVPEVIALAQMGVPVVAFNMVSNLAAGLSEGPLDHHEVTVAADAAGGDLGRLVRALVERWA
ncbi:MAG TPA: purine-nucleoside phosphorylase [Myxococcota bacterium]|nr:purine-nucleoside phosphorylase [Myxococcota bacterium]